MSEKDPVPGSSEDWLRRARADLALARAPLPEGALFEDLCFHAQQAAEKAIKAVYIYHGARFRYTHDIAELLTGLMRMGLSFPDEVKEAPRYPILPRTGTLVLWNRLRMRNTGGPLSWPRLCWPGPKNSLNKQAISSI